MVSVTAPPAASAGVKSALRTLDIFELLVRQARPMPANEIAATLGIPVSSLAYLLQTLVERRYLARTGRHYALGPALAALAPQRAPTLAERAGPLVRSLRQHLNETVSFFVRRGNEMEAIVTETGAQALRYSVEPGARIPLHGFSAGKALLAALPGPELEEYLATSERRAFTPNTVTDAGALREVLSAVRRSGFAHAAEEYTPGIRGLGRAVLAGGSVIGAFSVAVPVARYTPELEARICDQLARAAALLSASVEMMGAEGLA